MNRIEELEDRSVLEVLEAGTEMLSRGHDGYHIITTDQIAEAWEYANTHVEAESKMVEFALNELGIIRDGDGWRME
jgi:hypothetical protein